MLDKLLSVLPYNPSLLHQVAFYGKRMRREASMRRTGMIFIILAFMVQFFAVMSPPQPTVANSSNDLIDGGIKSVPSAVQACKRDQRYFKQILDHYGISCNDVAKSTTTTIKSTDFNKTLYSLGWKSIGSKNPRTGKPTGETRANIPGVGTLYWRFLWSWDTYQYSTYKVLKLKSSKTGKIYYILFDCGNLVSRGLPKPYTPPKPPKKPTPCPYNSLLPKDSPKCKPCEEAVNSQDKLACLEVAKTAKDTTQDWNDANGKTAKPGDEIVYTLYAKNKGKETIKQFVVEENLSDVLDYATVVNLHGGSIDEHSIVRWPAVDIKAGETITRQITVKVKTKIPSTPASTSDPSHYDLTMTNVYGNTVNIEVPGSSVKKVEAAAKIMPKTGPGSSLAIAGAITLLAGYFFARSRLLARESNIAVQEAAQTSGGF